jgi:hypothetical protein
VLSGRYKLKKVLKVFKQQAGDIYSVVLAELCHAATKIQASFRGHMARKQAPVATGGGRGKPEDDLSKELQKLGAKVNCNTLL